MSNINLIDYAVGELERTGIVSRKHLITGFVVRRSEVYPVYCLDYHKHLQVVRSYLDQFSNFQPIGRAGLFRYCNSDYAMLTGIFAAKNFLEKISYDIWKLGAEQEYFE
jgi:protoporphyrinogen oxidase